MHAAQTTHGISISVNLFAKFVFSKFHGDRPTSTVFSQCCRKTYWTDLVWFLRKILFVIPILKFKILYIMKVFFSVVSVIFFSLDVSWINLVPTSVISLGINKHFKIYRCIKDEELAVVILNLNNREEYVNLRSAMPDLPNLLDVVLVSVNSEHEVG